MWREVIDEEVTDIVNKAIKDEFADSRTMAVQHEMEPLWRKIIDNELENSYRQVFDRELQAAWKKAVKEELELWAENERYHQSVDTPSVKKKINRSHVKSAKQLPLTISRIDERVEEESPEALPQHHMPPQSYVCQRSSVIHSDSNFDNFSVDERQLRFNDDIHNQHLQMKGEENILFLRESKEDKMREYLRDRFKPPSEHARSQSRGSNYG